MTIDEFWRRRMERRNWFNMGAEKQAYDIEDMIAVIERLDERLVQLENERPDTASS